MKNIKSFDEYFQECIENKEFSEDTPPQFREALERAIKEYHEGIEKEKSALDDFAIKYIFKGDPGLTPVEYFNKVYKSLVNFFTNHRNIKFNMVLVCTMEQQIISKDKGVVGLKQDQAYFRSGTHINLKSTDVEKLIDKCVKKIIEDLEVFQKNGSGWYFNEVVQLEIHTVDFNPTEASSYLPLPDWITNKKAIINIQNKDEKCFLWCILRYLHPVDEKDNRLTDLKKWKNLKLIQLNIIQRRGLLTFLFQSGYQIKKQLLIYKTKMKNAFFGVYLDIFILKKEITKE